MSPSIPYSHSVISRPLGFLVYAPSHDGNIHCTARRDKFAGENHTVRLLPVAWYKRIHLT